MEHGALEPRLPGATIRQRERIVRMHEITDYIVGSSRESALISASDSSAYFARTAIMKGNKGNLPFTRTGIVREYAEVKAA
jgi:hypothetical protein